jgi:DNA-binding Lrp family transcriptional regulator
MDGERGNKEELEERILSLLSMNSRLGIDKLAGITGVSRNQVYDLLKKVVKKYDIRFVPEIDIDGLWKYEFLGLSWGKSKRELLETILHDEPAHIGFEQYVAMIEFKEKNEPTNEEIINATEGSYMPQYIARASGQCNVFMYLVARSSREVSRFMYKFTNNLSKFDMTLRLQFIAPCLGYFPLNDKFIEQTHIQSRYKKLLSALNSNARISLASLSDEFGGVSNMTMSSIHTRLKEMGVFKRPTLFMQKPNEQMIKLFIMSIKNRKKFSDNKYKMLINIANNSAKRYIFMANIKNPDGLLIIARFKDQLEIEKFKKEFDGLDLGVELTDSIIFENILGNLGIRNFAPEETEQYKTLKSDGLIKEAIASCDIGYKAVPKRTSNQKIDFAALSD